MRGTMMMVGVVLEANSQSSNILKIISLMCCSLVAVQITFNKCRRRVSLVSSKFTGSPLRISGFKELLKD